MDPAESDSFAGDTGDGVLVFVSDSLRRVLGCSLGVIAPNISLMEGCVSCSITSSVDGSVTLSSWSGNPSITCCAVGGLMRPLYCSMSRRLLPNRSPPCAVSVKS